MQRVKDQQCRRMHKREKSEFRGNLVENGGKMDPKCFVRFLIHKKDSLRDILHQIWILCAKKLNLNDKLVQELYSKEQSRFNLENGSDYLLELVLVQTFHKGQPAELFIYSFVSFHQ